MCVCVSPLVLILRGEETTNNASFTSVNGFWAGQSSPPASWRRGLLFFLLQLFIILIVDILPESALSKGIPGTVPSQRRAKREAIGAPESGRSPPCLLNWFPLPPPRGGGGEGAQEFPRAPRRPVHVSLAGREEGAPAAPGERGQPYPPPSTPLLSSGAGVGRAPLAGWAPLPRLRGGDPCVPGMGRGRGIPAGLRGLPPSRKRERGCAGPRRGVSWPPARSSIPQRWRVFGAGIRSVARWMYNTVKKKTPKPSKPTQLK